MAAYQLYDEQRRCVLPRTFRKPETAGAAARRIKQLARKYNRGYRLSLRKDGAAPSAADMQKFYEAILDLR